MKPITGPRDPITKRQLEAIEELVEELGKTALFVTKAEFNFEHLEIRELSTPQAGLVIAELRHFRDQFRKFKENRE